MLFFFFHHSPPSFSGWKIERRKLQMGNSSRYSGWYSLINNPILSDFVINHQIELLPKFLPINKTKQKLHIIHEFTIHLRLKRKEYIRI